MSDAICGICPNACELAPGEVGSCRARGNVDGAIVPLAYGRPCSIGVDPMEKKPLMHFHPGEKVLSLGMAGCNLHCANCQNAGISQASPNRIPSQSLPPEKVVDLLRERGIGFVAYTYTEPLVAYEYVFDCAKAVHEAGFANVLVSAGYVNSGPLKRLLPFIDAANIDLKAMSDDFYRTYCNASLRPVLESLIRIARSGVVLEITNLVIPTLNDSPTDLLAVSRFVLERLGPEVPVHFSRFFPRHELTRLGPTPIDVLQHARDIAHAEGLKHVYVGNTDEECVTSCASCGATLIRRLGYDVVSNRLHQGHCPDCGAALYGRY